MLIISSLSLQYQWTFTNKVKSYRQGKLTKVQKVQGPDTAQEYLVNVLFCLMTQRYE